MAQSSRMQRLQRRFRHQLTFAPLAGQGERFLYIIRGRIPFASLY